MTCPTSVLPSSPGEGHSLTGNEGGPGYLSLKAPYEERLNNRSEMFLKYRKLPPEGSIICGSI